MEQKDPKDNALGSENRRGPDGKFLPGVAQGPGPGRARNRFSFRHNLAQLAALPEEDWPAVPMCVGQELVMRRIRGIRELADKKDQLQMVDALINQVEGQPKQVVHELRPDLSNMNAEELRQLYKDYSDEIEDMEAGQT